MRFPEAILILDMKTITSARAMTEFFCKVGVPREILGGVMQQMYKRLNVKHVVTSVYHPQTNAIVEHFNGTLKAMLRRLCADTEATDWG